jgi:hypothetical protein
MRVVTDIEPPAARPIAGFAFQCDLP